mgnify:CR=1 FL=1
MLTGSMFGGACISATRTALAHSMSYPLTASLGVPHGLACSYTLPALLDYNAGADDGRIVQAAALAGYSSISELAGRLRRLFEDAGVKELIHQYGMNQQSIIALKGEMFTPNRAGNNLRPANEEQVKEILLTTLRDYIE